MVEPAVGHEFINNYDGLDMFEFVSNELSTLNGISVAMPLDSDLEQPINEAIQRLKDEGTLFGLVKNILNRYPV